MSRAGLVRAGRQLSTASSPSSFLACPACRPRVLNSLQVSVAQHPRKTVRRGYAAVAAADLQFGQPLHETHPHLLQAGELTPGITALEYHARRAKLASKLPIGGIAVLAASDVKFRSGSVFYNFHQDRDFFYLTGFNEPEALAIIVNNGDGDYTFHLYCREKDPKAELWEGARSGTQAALDVFNADVSGDIENLPKLLPPVIKAASEIHTDLITKQPLRSTFSRYMLGRTTKSEGFAKMLEGAKVKTLRPSMNELRVFKSGAEIANLRKAGKASGRAFTEAMKHRFEGERQLDSYLQYGFKRQGCEESAFVPVVAGGKNALSIHYVRNDDALRDGEMNLVDGGGEYGGYIADITRTWPVNGKFTGPQKDLYEAVLKVQRSCISLCRESANLSLDQLHNIAESTLKEQLKDLGFDLSGSAMSTLFPHHIGHYIGLDVHDCPGYPRRYDLKKGQCITIEPGVYVPEDERWPKHFQGIGIRIEDSVCIEEDNPLVLTTEAVKEVVDIEALRD